MTPDDFRKIGYELINFIADYREGIKDLPVMSQVKPGEVLKLFPATPPEQGGGFF